MGGLLEGALHTGGPSLGQGGGTACTRQKGGQLALQLLELAEALALRRGEGTAKHRMQILVLRQKIEVGSA